MKKLIPILFTILIINGLTAQNENNQNALNGVLTPIQQAVGMNNTNTAEKAKATSSEQRAASTYTETEDYIDKTYEEETYADEFYNVKRATMSSWLQPNGNNMPDFFKEKELSFFFDKPTSL